VFRALGNPIRRHLLDLLFNRDGRSLSELEAGLGSGAEMTRFGVMKHLRVLEEAGLVISRRSGREKLHFLNPVPIRLIHDRWIDKFTERQVSALVDLKKELENPMTTAEQAITQMYHIFIKTTPQRIWDAITKPEFTARYFFGAQVETTAQVGSPFRYHSPDGTSLWGDETVLESDPPRRLVVSWRSLYNPDLAEEPASRVAWEIEPQDGGVCKLTVVHDQLDNSPKTAANVAGPGWMMVLSSMKTLLETGAPLIPA
jgi:uncharacterized protein YndB with AHSA1/START domain